MRYFGWIARLGLDGSGAMRGETMSKVALTSVSTFGRGSA
jgi:hypothetical protein